MRRYLLLTFSSLAILCSTTEAPCSGNNCGGPTCCGAELFSDCGNGGCATEWTKEHDSDFRQLAASLGGKPIFIQGLQRRLLPLPGEAYL